MARYKPVDYAQGQFIPVSFEHQILPGSFEHALNFIVDNKLDFSALDAVRTNDDAGAPAYDPRVMLKIVLCAHSRGIFSSREIEAACQQDIVMMALSANTRPHFTTIAQFIRELGPAMTDLFVGVLLYCNELGLIGKDMFAIDGCKFSSNASKEWSGTHAEFEKKRDKFRAAFEKLVANHRAMDKDGLSESVPGKMASGHGVIQGYNGVAVVDAKHQVIVGAEAFGKAHEAGILGPLLEQVRETFKGLKEKDIYRKAKVCADTGFHTEESIAAIFAKKIDAYIPDMLFRKRNPAFKEAGQHRSFKALIGRDGREKRFFTAAEFILDPKKGKLICPAGKELYIKDRNARTPAGYRGTTYMAKITDCRVCPLRNRRLRRPNSRARTVLNIEGHEKGETFSQRMSTKVDSEVGRFLYGMRMGIVEPVFANLRHMLGLDRFTLRGSGKVNIQWRLYSIVHNIHKIQRYGWAGAG